MSNTDFLFKKLEPRPPRERRPLIESSECEGEIHSFYAYASPTYFGGSDLLSHSHFYSAAVPRQHQPASDWADVAPALIEKLAKDIVQKKKSELRFNILEHFVTLLQARIEHLESVRPIIVSIDTFAPEPYDLSKPIVVSIQPVGDEFEAGWFDASIHASGANQQEAIDNLKGLILDYFDSLSKEPLETLGAGLKRQIDLMKKYIKKSS